MIGVTNGKIVQLISAVPSWHAVLVTRPELDGVAALSKYPVAIWALMESDVGVHILPLCSKGSALDNYMSLPGFVGLLSPDQHLRDVAKLAEPVIAAMRQPPPPPRPSGASTTAQARPTVT